MDNVSYIFFIKCLYFSYYMAGYLLDRPCIYVYVYIYVYICMYVYMCVYDTAFSVLVIKPLHMLFSFFF